MHVYSLSAFPNCEPACPDSTGASGVCWAWHVGSVVGRCVYVCYGVSLALASMLFTLVSGFLSPVVSGCWCWCFVMPECACLPLRACLPAVPVPQPNTLCVSL